MLEQQQQQQAGGVATSAAREAREPSAGLQTRPQSQSHLPTGPPQQAAATPTKLDSQQQEEQTRHASTPQQQAQAPQGPPPSQGSSVPSPATPGASWAAAGMAMRRSMASPLATQVGHTLSRNVSVVASLPPLPPPPHAPFNP